VAESKGAKVMTIFTRRKYNQMRYHNNIRNIALISNTDTFIFQLGNGSFLQTMSNGRRGWVYRLIAGADYNFVYSSVLQRFHRPSMVSLAFAFAFELLSCTIAKPQFFNFLTLTLCFCIDHSAAWNWAVKIWTMKWLTASRQSTLTSHTRNHKLLPSNQPLPTNCNMQAILMAPEQTAVADSKE
jgi:hypothetical protein